MFIYHVTFLHRLPGIQESGLETGRAANFRGYAGYSKGRIFFTEWDGVPFWMERIAALAENATDNPEEGWVPIVVRAHSEEIEQDLVVDEPGTKDAQAKAFYVEGNVEVGDIEVWDGKGWEYVEDVDADVLVDVAKDAAEDAAEYGGWVMDYEVFAPVSEE